MGRLLAPSSSNTNLMMNLLSMRSYPECCFHHDNWAECGRMDLHSFVEQAGARLTEHAEPLTASVDTTKWADGGVGGWGMGVGSDAVEVLHDLTDDEEGALMDRAVAWQREKFDVRYNALTWLAEPRPETRASRSDVPR